MRVITLDPRKRLRYGQSLLRRHHVEDNSFGNIVELVTALTLTFNLRMSMKI
jgi:hypothetical protein